MNNNRIMFLRNESRHPVGCVAIKVNRDFGTVEYQLSVLNPLDNFERALARHIALGRLVEKPFSVNIKKDANMNDISHAVMQDIANNKLAPKRAIKAAKYWISSYRNSF